METPDSDEAALEQLVFQVTATTADETLLRVLGELGQKALQDERNAKHIRFLGCVSRCLRLAEHENPEVSEAACAVVANLSGSAAENAFVYDWACGSMKLVLERASYITAGLGYQVWPSAYVMAGLLQEGKIDINDKDIIELGCGIGIIGLVSAQCGAASVLLTDYHEVVLDTALKNIHRNNVQDKVRVCRVDWRDLAPDPEAIPDAFREDYIRGDANGQMPTHGQGCACESPQIEYPVVLATDCIYDKGHAALVPLAIDAYLSKSDRDAVCWVVLPSAKYRNAIADFETFIQQRFEVAMHKDWTAFPSKENEHTLYEIRRRFPER